MSSGAVLTHASRGESAGRQGVELAKELLGAVCSRAQLRRAASHVGGPAIAEALSTAVCSHVLLVAVDQREPVDRTCLVAAVVEDARMIVGGQIGCVLSPAGAVGSWARRGSPTRGDRRGEPVMVARPLFSSPFRGASNLPEWRAAALAAYIRPAASAMASAA